MTERMQEQFAQMIKESGAKPAREIPSLTKLTILRHWPKPAISDGFSGLPN